ncbi:MAG TPA: NrfD/PsrC family molybdoenzyme membrane anchor subunit [Actinomycetota bacterium]|nr:NrfD/PsrC family molybdoenzyme membrane anchor subunit [Actinomycetota bacterium]
MSGGDGRNVDARTGELSGEAAPQRAPEARDTGGAAPHDVFEGTPSRRGDAPTYYDRPVLKEPVWIWAVPVYFFLGGAAGGASVLGAAAQVLGRGRLDGLVARCRVLAAVGTAAGSALLVYDLGRRDRFLNMLRVFRPTSAISVGSWILAASGGASGAAAVLGARRTRWLVPDAAGLAAGALGGPLATYTGVLLADTSVPLWREGRRTLPVLFAASGLAGATSLLSLADLDEDSERVVHRLDLAASAAELALAVALEREVGRVESVGKPLKEGVSGALWKASTALGVASMALSLPRGPSRARNALSALLGAAGGLALRFAVFRAGFASARDASATFDLQRSRSPE